MTSESTNAYRAFHSLTKEVSNPLYKIVENKRTSPKKLEKVILEWLEFCEKNPNIDLKNSDIERLGRIKQRLTTINNKNYPFLETYKERILQVIDQLLPKARAEQESPFLNLPVEILTSIFKNLDSLGDVQAWKNTSHLLQSIAQTPVSWKESPAIHLLAHTEDPQALNRLKQILLDPNGDKAIQQSIAEQFYFEADGKTLQKFFLDFTKEEFGGFFSLLNDRANQQTHKVILGGPWLTGERLGWIVEKSPHLEQLTIISNTLTDNDLKILTKLPHLKILNVSRCQKITGQFLQDVVKPDSKLEEVHLSALNQLDPSNLSKLGELTHLRILNLSHNAKIKTQHLAFLAQLPRLAELDLSQNANVGDEVLEFLKGSSSLETLRLTYSRTFTGEGIAHLSKEDKLSSVNLSGNRLLSDENVLRLSSHSQLRSLVLDNCPSLSGASLSTTELLTQLEQLVCGKWKTFKEEDIAKLPESLQELTINESPGLRAEVLMPLNRLSSLEKLELGFNPNLDEAKAREILAPLQERLKKLDFPQYEMDNLD